jgi:SWI/SNF-related matrix-associated actin-dependent regulator of chromatin subfamily A3
MIETALRTNGFLFQRIDGQKSLEQRIRALHAFNNDPTCTVMLASIGSVAEGYGLAFIFTMNSDCAHFSMRSRRVDLAAANYVHLVEPHWNPMLEEQALDRVHRIGQTRDVMTIRYIVNNSIETVRPFSRNSWILPLLVLLSEAHTLVV